MNTQPTYSPSKTPETDKDAVEVRGANDGRKDNGVEFS
jgi:hypothetical protein